MKNNRGFMLAEAVVASSVVLTTLVFLYTTFNKLYSNYSVRETYFDVDGEYIAGDVVDNLMINGKFGNVINGTYYLLVDSTNLTNCTNALNSSYCNSLKDLGVSKLYIVKYNSSSIDSLINSMTADKDFSDYVKYLKNYYNLSSSEYNYLVIVKYYSDMSKNKFYYSNLGIG